MKKRSVIAALLCSLCLTAGGAVPAMADSARVVTLGADLTQDQKDTMMRYFKTDVSQVQILTITNQDEREHLGDYIPLEQIGTRTLSCAYVKPTSSLSFTFFILLSPPSIRPCSGRAGSSLHP